MKALTTLLTAFGLVALIPAQSDRPNVILVMADDQGWGDAGFRDHPQLETPTLDELAATAVRFERFYAAAPVCSPTRGSCLTGRHPFRYGVRNANAGHLLDAEVHLAGLLKAAGYTTGHFGKWHLGTLTTTEPDSNRGGPAGAAHYAPPWERDFDRCFSTEAKVPTFDPMITPPRWAGGVGRKQEGSPYGTAYWNERGERIPDDELRGDDSRLIMDRAIPFVEAAVADGTPFFAVVWFHAPHLPVIAGPEHTAPYADIEDPSYRHYYGCITALDEQVGRLRAKLRELGVAEDTMLWYCADNGPEGRDDRAPGTTAGLRGRKRSLYEGGVRVPAFLEWPGRFGDPAMVTAPCVTSDYLPTILDALGLELPDRPLDGISLLPLLRGETDARRTGIGFQHGRMQSWVGDRFKLVRRDGRVELYDLVADPGEQQDLAADQPATVEAMSAALDAWLTSCAASAEGADYRRDEPPAEADDRPNLVVLFADDLGYGDLGCYGNTRIRTPRIDQMAAEGMRFTDFQVQTVCGPSRTALMTGCYPMRVARRQNRVDIHPRLHPREITLAEVLKTRGYATGCYGKWDLAGHSQTDFDPELLPLQQGFDEFLGTPTSNDRVVHMVRGNEIVERDADMATLTRRYTDAALDFIRRHRDQPFFVYLPHTMPHTRLAASEQFAGNSERGLYGDVVEEIDWNTGRILDLIDELGLDERTWVVFLSDNGPWWIKRQNGGAAGPLRGAKTSVWEGGVRVPCIVRAPGRVEAGTTCDVLASSLDLLPTLANLAGASAPDDRVLDGRDITPLLRGEEPTGPRPRTLFHYVHTHLQAVRHGRWKLHLPRAVQPPWTPRWAGHIPPDDRIEITEPLLFDLDADLGEQHDVAAEHPEVVAELTALAEAARDELGDHDRLGSGQRFYDPEPRRPDLSDK